MNKYQFLIVEDESIIALQIKMDLINRGHDVCGIVGEGEQAIELVKEMHPDIVLMDRQLKGEIDGLEAAMQIRSFSQIPIIFMSGYSLDVIKERMEKLQPAAYLDKPIAWFQLESAIQFVMNKND